MIIRLKRRVFWSILLSAAGILLAILLAINVLNTVQTASKRDSILDSALMLLQSAQGPERDRGDMRGGGRERAELLRSVSEDELGVIEIGADGALISAVGCAEQMDEATLTSIAEAARNDPDGRGRADGWEYKTVPTDGGTGVALLDAASLRREVTETLLLSLAGFAAACGLFALLAGSLSRTIVRPVEENMQMQKRFVADASHELKTPLTVIDANASVLEQSIGRNRWLDYNKEQSDRMSGLVNELLQLSRREEAGDAGTPQEREIVDAAETIMTAALTFESVAFERGVALETEVPDSLDTCGSRKDLEQLAAILIDNAVKHSGEGGTIRVSLARSVRRHGRKEQSVLELRVSNTGEGIPAEALPHIFERFYRADESRTHKDNSYGLGLAIAKGLADRNCGSLAAESREGLTEFTLVLPLE